MIVEWLYNRCPSNAADPNPAQVLLEMCPASWHESIDTQGWTVFTVRFHRDAIVAHFRCWTACETEFVRRCLDAWRNETPPCEFEYADKYWVRHRSGVMLLYRREWCSVIGEFSWRSIALNGAEITPLDGVELSDEEMRRLIAFGEAERVE